MKQNGKQGLTHEVHVCRWQQFQVQVHAVGHSWKLSVYATIAMGISVCGEEREEEEEEEERIEVQDGATCTPPM